MQEEVSFTDLDNEILARVSPFKIRIGSLADELGVTPRQVADRCKALRVEGYGLMVTDPIQCNGISHKSRFVHVEKNRWARVQTRVEQAGLSLED